MRHEFRIARIAVLAARCRLPARPVRRHFPLRRRPSTPPANFQGRCPLCHGHRGDLIEYAHFRPRHAKAPRLAGRAENWALANYALSELRQVSSASAKAVPKFPAGMPGAGFDRCSAPPRRLAPWKRRDSPKKTRQKNSPPLTDRVDQGCNALPHSSFGPSIRGHQDTRPFCVPETRNLAARRSGVNVA